MSKAYVKVTKTTTRKRVGEGTGKQKANNANQKRCPNCGKFMK